MITKILSKIKIHPFFYVTSLITIITGFFKEFSLIMLIITVHELGHILTALYFKWNIEKIVVLPFGGLTIFNEKINKPLKEELLIAISGVTIQILVFSLSKNPILLKYHCFLLIFNLLPIIPLDGSKILNCFLNYFFPFKLSHLISIITSLILCFIFFIKFNLVTLIVFSFILFKIYEEYINHKNIFNKFLFERYIYNINFNKRKKIKDYKLTKMSRDYKHLFCINNSYCSEREILKKRFDI